MKKLTNLFSAVAVLLILASCGGSAEKDIVGTWKLDANSVDLQLGEGFPAEMKDRINSQKDQMTSNSEEIDGMTIEFKEDGKLVLAKDGEKADELDATWAVEDDKLVIQATIEGQQGKIKLNLDEVSSEKVALSLTAEEVLAQVKAQMPEALEQVPPQMDVEGMAKGTKLMFALKK
jgi:hypothetical protein